MIDDGPCNRYILHIEFNELGFTRLGNFLISIDRLHQTIAKSQKHAGIIGVKKDPYKLYITSTTAGSIYFYFLMDPATFSWLKAIIDSVIQGASISVTATIVDKLLSRSTTQDENQQSRLQQRNEDNQEYLKYKESNTIIKRVHTITREIRNDDFETIEIYKESDEEMRIILKEPPK